MKVSDFKGCKKIVYDVLTTGPDICKDSDVELFIEVRRREGFAINPGLSFEENLRSFMTFGYSYETISRRRQYLQAAGIGIGKLKEKRLEADGIMVELVKQPLV